MHHFLLLAVLVNHDHDKDCEGHVNQDRHDHKTGLGLLIMLVLGQPTTCDLVFRAQKLLNFRPIFIWIFWTGNELRWLG